MCKPKLKSDFQFFVSIGWISLNTLLNEILLLLSRMYNNRRFCLGPTVNRQLQISIGHRVGSDPAFLLFRSLVDAVVVTLAQPVRYILRVGTSKIFPRCFVWLWTDSGSSRGDERRVHWTGCKIAHHVHRACYGVGYLLQIHSRRQIHYWDVVFCWIFRQAAVQIEIVCNFHCRRNLKMKIQFWETLKIQIFAIKIKRLEI